MPSEVFIKSGVNSDLLLEKYFRPYNKELPTPLQGCKIYFPCIVFDCMDLPFCLVLKISDMHSQLYSNSAGSSAFRWQEAALAMETAVWADVLQVKHRHTHTHAVWCHSDSKTYRATPNQKRTNAQSPALFIQTITFNNWTHTHTHIHTHSPL